MFCTKFESASALIRILNNCFFYKWSTFIAVKPIFLLQELHLEGSAAGSEGVTSGFVSTGTIFSSIKKDYRKDFSEVNYHLVFFGNLVQESFLFFVV
jgi:hypothetical protein